MKNLTIILIAFICLNSCTKQNTSIINPTTKELNEQYTIKYGKIGFYTSDKNAPLLSLQVSILPNQTAWVGYQENKPECNNSGMPLSIEPNVIATYTAIQYNDVTDKSKGIKSQWTGTVTSNSGECNVIDIREK